VRTIKTSAYKFGIQD